MKATARFILQSARISELRTSVVETAALCEQQVPMQLPYSPASRRRCLLQLLVLERRRNAKLVSVVENG